MSTKISELTAATALAGTESVPVVQAGSTVRATASAIAASAPFVVFDGATGTIVASRGVTGVSRGSAGRYTVTLSSAAASAWLAVFTAEATDGKALGCVYGASTSTTIELRTNNGAAGTAEDADSVSAVFVAL